MRKRARLAGVAASSLMIVTVAVTTAIAKLPTQPPTTDDPSHGGHARPWTVVIPPLFPITGPTSQPQPHCTAAKVTAHATTRPIPGGVAGIVHLKGDHCSIYSHGGPDELRGGDTTLDVDATPWSQQTDPLDTGRSDIPRDQGNLSWSFTWTGSWCGNKPTAIVVPLVKDGGDVLARFHGPTPGCHANPGNIPSVLTPGAPAYPGIPDMAPGAGWSGLTASLSMPKVLHSTAIKHLVVTFTNSTDADISLAPCPTYALGAGGKHGGGTAAGYGDPLPCPYTPRIVPANGKVRVHLPNSQFFPRAVPARGGRLTVTFEILGVPPATAHARVAWSK